MNDQQSGIIRFSLKFSLHADIVNRTNVYIIIINNIIEST